MSADCVEKTFAPFRINLGKALGLDRKLEVEVHPEADIIASECPVICYPVRFSADMQSRITGSAKTTCGVCSQEVWIAPSGQRIIAAGKNPVICTECFLAKGGAA
jgi:hypothetical protein